jgi:DNA polymerase III gamma/tau subunit
LKDLLPLNAEEISQLRTEAAKASAEEILRYLLALQQAEQGLRYSSHPQIYLETVLVKLGHFKKIVPLQDLIQEVEKITKERQTTSGSPSEPSSGIKTGGSEEHGIEPRLKPGPVRSAPRIKAEEDKDVFHKILDELQKEKSSLAAVFSRQTSFQIKDETLDIKFHPEKRFVIENPVILEISFPAGENFYREAIQKDMKTVERIASAVIGQKVKVRLIDAVDGNANKRDKELETALKDPTVQTFMDTFKAQVLSVEPIKRAKERE